MSEDSLRRGLVVLEDGIRVCMAHKNALAALVLIYSAIDSVGWLASDQPYASRTTFLEWVDCYMLPNPTLNCTAIDLYAARCGVLHTFSSNSALSDRGEARRACYAWGTATARELDEALAAGFDEDLVAIHIGDLFESWRSGASAFLCEIDSDPERRARAFDKAGEFYSPAHLSTWHRAPA